MATQPSIRDWPEGDRPREKLQTRGVEALSDAELLAVVLRSGDREANAVDQARALIATFGGFRSLAQKGFGDLCAIKGIGPVKASQILAVMEIAKRFGEHELKPGELFRSSADIYAHFRERLASERHEQFYAVLLDSKHRKIKDIAVSRGSLTQSVVHPRDVFLPVVREAAAAVVFVHNHPSGDPTPSQEDILVTRRLREVGEVMGVRVLDHIVIGRGSYVSLVEGGFW